MSKFLLVFTAVLLVSTVISTSNADDKTPNALSFKMKSLAGKEVDLGKYKGKVVLIVNTASECGLTPQYEQLQALHTHLDDNGLAVLGFPCNQFGGQEPGTAAEITSFCKQNYGVTFDMFAKVEVNGDGACPLYKHLTAADTKPQKSGNVGWNFEKFVLDRKGDIVGRFGANTSPDDPALLKLIKSSLAAE